MSLINGLAFVYKECKFEKVFELLNCCKNLQNKVKQNLGVYCFQRNVISNKHNRGILHVENEMFNVKLIWIFHLLLFVMC